MSMRAERSTTARHTYERNMKENVEFRFVERGELSVRIVENVAIMVGPLRQTVVVRATEQTHENVELIATQVWIRVGYQWKHASFHVCIVKPH
jgi:hypothetical protein